MTLDHYNFWTVGLCEFAAEPWNDDLWFGLGIGADGDEARRTLFDLYVRPGRQLRGHVSVETTPTAAPSACSGHSSATSASGSSLQRNSQWRANRAIELRRQPPPEHGASVEQSLTQLGRSSTSFISMHGT